eukprot:symbB.v1.2.002510.t1/scaffold132.1/size310437/21
MLWRWMQRSSGRCSSSATGVGCAPMALVLEVLPGGVIVGSRRKWPSFMLPSWSWAAAFAAAWRAVTAMERYYPFSVPARERP